MRFPPGVRMLGPSMAKCEVPKHHSPSMASANAREGSRHAQQAANPAAATKFASCFHTVIPSGVGVSCRTVWSIIRCAALQPQAGCDERMEALSEGVHRKT